MIKWLKSKWNKLNPEKVKQERIQAFEEFFKTPKVEPVEPDNTKLNKFSIQLNGIEIHNTSIGPCFNKDQIEKYAIELLGFENLLVDQKIVKTVFVPNKIINIVTVSTIKVPICAPNEKQKA